MSDRIEPPYDSTTDRPRKVVICHPDDFTRVNAAVMSMRLGDVLVRPDQIAEEGRVYVMDVPFTPRPADHRRDADTHPRRMATDLAEGHTLSRGIGPPFISCERGA